MRTELQVTDSLLERLGLGPLRRESVTEHRGRWRAITGVTRQGAPVFVKHITDPAVFARAVAFERFAVTLPDLPRPRCLGWDTRESLIVFAHLRGTVDGLRAAEQGSFDVPAAAELGRILALLHGAPVAGDCPLRPAEQPHPPVALLESVTLPAFLEASGAELELLGILHGDGELAAAATRLAEEARAVAPVPCHADLRLDQLLLGAGGIWLADWDQACRTDPARDIGAFLGEWLYRSARKIGSGAAAGIADFGSTRPLVAEFWSTYRSARTGADEKLARRSVAFAGWHQIDRVLAIARSRARLHPVERAAVGIGRVALLSPADLTEAVGLCR
ncbi:class V lanthionine synthetase subunit LxmK [Sciscionella sediminilitoris]|uniref:class V lanthionine synthetase subunit LxmK n=1 Tax=Sciscionella sediminilitoris TaxID=1445613 RepID=UPI0009EA8D97|nr:class V lanthionine synthetase subunit LxmK [Sciscionella sp. SE31]